MSDWLRAALAYLLLIFFIAVVAGLTWWALTTLQQKHNNGCEYHSNTRTWTCPKDMK